MSNGDRPERLFAEEEPGEPDFASALKWARPAAEAGSAKAQAVLAYVLTCGPEEMRDLEAAHRWYQRSAAAGCPEGCLGYALSLAPRTQDEAGRHEVAEHLRRAAEAELPTAIYLLAVLTEQGVGVARDPAVAAELYRHAAERGQRSAQLRWGLALMEGRDVEQDLVLGESWLRRAALAGDPDAAALVGDLYVKNGRLPPNYTEAAGWYRRAAEAGHIAAARALGSLVSDRRRGGGGSRRGGALAAGLGRSRRPGLAGRPRQSRARRRRQCGRPGHGSRSGSSRPPPRAISSPRSISGSASTRASVSSPTRNRRRTGCAAPPRACRRRSTCTAGCWPMGAA